MDRITFTADAMGFVENDPGQLSYRPFRSIFEGKNKAERKTT